MKLLIDTDAFCKLGVANVLDDFVGLLGVDLPDCGRLPALPYMLRRGRLRKVYGENACDALIPIANALPAIGQASESWLDRLAPVETIDPGEAQIFATAAEIGIPVVSGDKRALRALGEVEGFPEALAGRIIVVEAVLIALCDHLGSDEVRRRIQPLEASDIMVQMCFSDGNPEPRESLLSYYRSLAREIDPFVLWSPGPEGGA